MATQTPNYNLIKPDYSDPVDVAVLNDNADLIDAALAGKANLVGGKVPSSELPSYVGDVVEGYYDSGTFYEDSAHTTPLTGETGKIYVDLPSNISYRWSGSAYVSLSKVDDVRDHNGNSLVVDGIATLPEYESNIVDVQDEEGNSLVNADKIAIVPAGGAVNDVQDAEGNSLVVDKIATLPVIPEYGKMFEIVDYTEGGNTYIKYTGSELYDLINDINRDTVYCYYGKPIQYCRFVASDDHRFGILTAGANTLPSMLEYRLNSKRVVSSQNYGWTSETPYTVNEKSKLSLIEDRAEVNIINAVERADGTAVVPVNKKIVLPAQVVISDTEPTDTSVLWIDTSDDTVDGIDNGEEISFPQEVGE